MLEKTQAEPHTAAWYRSQMFIKFSERLFVTRMADGLLAIADGPNPTAPYRLIYLDADEQAQLLRMLSTLNEDADPEAERDCAEANEVWGTNQAGDRT